MTYDRYAFEHIFLPLLFEHEKIKLSSFVFKNGDAAIRNLCDMAFGKDGNPCECPFGPEDFNVTHRTFFRGHEALAVIRVEMPAPEIPPQCRAVYLCSSQKENKLSYFTSEMTTDSSYMLCRWEDEMHINYGSAPTALADEFARVADLFWDIHGYDDQGYIQP